MSKFQIARVWEQKKTNIWLELQNILNEYKPVDLAVGYANFLPENNVLACLNSESFLQDASLHQYTKSIAGHPKLLETISKYYSPLLNRKISPTEEILITVGATHAIDLAIRSHVNQNEEVIIIEPSFTIYEPMIKSVGGIVRYVTLRPEDGRIPTESSQFVFDYEELQNAFNENTKMIIINTPMNPTGKLLTEKECTVIADLCKKWDVLCLSDEVYEELVYLPNKLCKIATLPDMWERTITVGSVGKMFHVTGWKTGWAYGGARLLKNMKVVFIDTNYACCTPIQEAIANCLESEIANRGTEKSLLKKTLKDLEEKRKYAMDCLQEAGMHPILPEAGYFITVDWTNFIPFMKTTNGKQPTGLDFIKWLIETCKVLCIPIDSFYCPKNVSVGDRYIRIAFIRDMDTLVAGMNAIKELKKICK